MASIDDLIREARTSPPKPILADLLNENEIAGLHGTQEVFKTVLAMQLAESLALGTPFLDIWQVPHARRVFFFETEMSPSSLGRRLGKMYPALAPGGIEFADNTKLRAFRRAPNLQAKFALLSRWVGEYNSEVLILDTANPCFRGRESPNDEVTVGSFFDLLEALPVSARFFVRHNHKRREEDNDNEAAARIRGSGQFADVPDLLMELRRPDKRTNEAVLAITKYRHGPTRDDLMLWFDRVEIRLVSVPPVIQLLRKGPLSRPELLEAIDTRFGVKQRAADALIKAQQPYPNESMNGHTRVFAIDWQAARDGNAEWYTRTLL